MRRPIRHTLVVLVLLTGGLLAASVALQHSGRRTTGAGRGGEHPSGRVRVEVLNGGGRAGAAREATEQLRDKGFDVVYFGNAESFDVDSSSAVDRTGDPDLARAVAQALGIGRVRSEPDSTLYLDVSVVLGKDWPPTSDVPPGGTSRGSGRHWWDPRGWFGR